MLWTEFRPCSWSLQTKCFRVASTPVLWIPLTSAPPLNPERTGSSPVDSNPLPPSGERWILMVGPRIQWAPLSFASSPILRPAFSSKVRLKVEAKAVPHGKHAPRTLPLKSLLPLTPLGPSDKRRDGIPYCGKLFVCQISTPLQQSGSAQSPLEVEVILPDSNSTFSESDNRVRMSSGSNADMVSASSQEEEYSTARRWFASIEPPILMADKNMTGEQEGTWVFWLSKQNLTKARVLATGSRYLAPTFSPRQGFNVVLFAPDLTEKLLPADFALDFDTNGDWCCPFTPRPSSHRSEEAGLRTSLCCRPVICQPSGPASRTPDRLVELPRRLHGN